ncbi:MAG: hypothetical protein DSM106950_10215 [Stigonema ocellatum SAG 48.90 = DSM 106950]|nr:hypothetical protein [Stigonema ocellatum SAG 48.90 = DSM 106950]
MSNTSLPENPDNRRAILIVRTSDLKTLKTNPRYNLQILNNPQICLLPIPVRNEDKNDLFRKLEQDGLLSPGNLLIQNPYDTDKYVEAVEATSSFTVQKALHFSYFCQLLGAKKVFIDRMEVINTEGKIIFNTNIKGNSLPASGNVGTENTSFEKIKSQLKLDDSFIKIEPNVTEAEKYLNQHHIGDIIMNDLLQRCKKRLLLQSREVVLSLTKESQKNLKIALSIDIPLYINLTSQIDRLKKDLYEYNVVIKVEF